MLIVDLVRDGLLLPALLPELPLLACDESCCSMDMSVEGEAVLEDDLFAPAVADPEELKLLTLVSDRESSSSGVSVE